VILFRCTRGNAHVITYAPSREGAKITAQRWLGGDPDRYTVEPLTAHGDRIHFSVTLSV
jgi:hypothetical protein